MNKEYMRANATLDYTRHINAAHVARLKIYAGIDANGNIKYVDGKGFAIESIKRQPFF